MEDSHAADLVRSRTYDTLRTWSGAGPTTERGRSGARPGRPELAVSESYEAGANKPHTLRTEVGAGSATELSCQNVAIRSRAGRASHGRTEMEHTSTAVDLGRSWTRDLVIMPERG